MTGVAVIGQDGDEAMRGCAAKPLDPMVPAMWRLEVIGEALSGTQFGCLENGLEDPITRGCPLETLGGETRCRFACF